MFGVWSNCVLAGILIVLSCALHAPACARLEKCNTIRAEYEVILLRGMGA